MSQKRTTPRPSGISQSRISQTELDDRTRFGEAVRRAREKSGFSQRRLAEYIGHGDNSTISRVELGQGILPPREQHTLFTVLPALRAEFPDKAIRADVWSPGNSIGLGTILLGTEWGVATESMANEVWILSMQELKTDTSGQFHSVVKRNLCERNVAYFYIIPDTALARNRAAYLCQHLDKRNGTKHRLTFVVAPKTSGLFLLPFDEVAIYDPSDHAHACGALRGHHHGVPFELMLDNGSSLREAIRQFYGAWKFVRETWKNGLIEARPIDGYEATPTLSGWV